MNRFTDTIPDPTDRPDISLRKINACLAGSAPDDTPAGSVIADDNASRAYEGSPAIVQVFNHGPAIVYLNLREDPDPASKKGIAILPFNTYESPVPVSDVRVACATGESTELTIIIY